jgi:hypothetical protein
MIHAFGAEQGARWTDESLAVFEKYQQFNKTARRLP